MKPIPYLHKEDGRTILMVQGEPFLALAGEVHNSSCSDMEFVKQHVFDEAKHKNCNTLLLPLYWELIEEKEGIYDFSSIESLINLAREQELHIVFLWFGLWKNGLSTYIPTWMKLDQERFFFAQDMNKNPIYSISPFCKEAIEKDAACFQACMKRIREIDEQTQTVIMMQVENEMGILGSDLDYHIQFPLEDRIPNPISVKLNTQGTWRSVFGRDAADRYMAFAYASAVEQIASKGKEAYPIPMYVNAWLKKETQKAGEYPSGGPHQENIEMYQMVAPSIDFCAPDCYIEDCQSICEQYAKQGVLCIPETRQDPQVISILMYAIGSASTILVSPFGIEDIWRSGASDEKQESMYDLLGIEKRAFQPEGTYPLLEQFYCDMRKSYLRINEWQRQGILHAFLQEGTQTMESVSLKNASFLLHYLKKDNTDRGAAWIIEEKDQYVLYLRQCAILLDQESDSEILVLEEGNFHEQGWQRTRILNGDERYQIFATAKPRFFRLTLFTIERK